MRRSARPPTAFLEGRICFQGPGVEFPPVLAYQAERGAHPLRRRDMSCPQHRRCNCRGY